MYWIAESKVEDLQWFKFNGPKAIKLGVDKQFNQKHPLMVRPDELVGLRKATRGPGAGNYQVRLGHAVHVLFRNVPQKMIDKIVDYLKPYKGKLPERGSLEEGKKRNTKVTIREKSESNKLIDDLYKPTGTIREHSTYNRENYQWRKVVHGGTRIKTKKQGKTVATLQPDDVVGVRYMTKARGGFVILPNMQRVNIDHDTYMQIVGSARIQPTSKQQKGIVVTAEVKATLPKQTRVRKPKEPEPDVRTSRPGPGIDSGRRVGRDIKRNGQIYKHEDIPNLDFEDDEDDIVEEETPVSTVPASHKPVAVLKLGVMIQSAKRSSNKFIIVDAKEENGFTEFSLYTPEKKDVRKLRIATDTDMSKYKSVQVTGEANKSELAAGRRAFNKAVKEKKFTSGSIHDQ